MESALPICESECSIRAPMVKTDIGTETNELIIKIVNKRQCKVFQIQYSLHTNIDISYILNMIEERAKHFKIKRLQ